MSLCSADYWDAFVTGVRKSESRHTVQTVAIKVIPISQSMSFYSTLLSYDYSLLTRIDFVTSHNGRKGMSRPSVSSQILNNQKKYIAISMNMIN